MKDENETVSAAAHHRVTSQRSRDAPRDSVTFVIFHFSFFIFITQSRQPVLPQ
jgi:hypothetical protein